LIAGDENESNEDYSLALFATMAGALVIARAVSDQELSDRILRVTTTWIEGAVRAGRP
jgi:hypothetical protein